MFTHEEEKILTELAKSIHAPGLVRILKRIKDKMGDVDDITGDYGAQVEGRKLFKKMAGDLITRLERPEARGRRMESTDFS